MSGIQADRRRMPLPPGSSAWLLRHELRLLARAWRIDRMAADGARLAWLLGLLMVVVHLLMWTVVWMFPKAPPTSAAGQMVLASLVALFAGFMLMTALSRGVEALFERGDLDLLLASPVDPRAILLARVAGVAFAVLLGTGVLLLPLVNMAVATGARWLWPLYAVIPLAALALAALAMLLSLLLVRLIGARRARTWLQVLSLLAYAAGFLASQVNQQRVAQWAQSMDPLATAPVWATWLGGLATGAAGPFAALVLSAVVLPLVCWATLGRVFLRGSQESLHTAARPAARRQRTTRTRWPAVLWHKEWRCIGRDPLLLMRIGTSVIYLLPLGFVLMRDTGDRPDWLLPIAAGLVAAAVGTLARALTTLTVNADEAPGLLLSAPRDWPQIVRAKRVAAFWPSVALGCCALLACTAMLGPRMLLTATWVPLMAWGVAAAVALHGKPMARELYGKQRHVDIDVLVRLAGVILLGTTGAALAVSAWPWSTVPFAAAFSALLWRQERQLAAASPAAFQSA